MTLHTLRHVGLTTVLVAALAIGTAGGVADASGTRDSADAAREARPTASAVAPHNTAKPPRVLKRVGVSLPLKRLAGFIKATGSTPNQLSIYQQWATHDRFDAVAASAAKKRGMTILVNWEPWSPTCDCADQPKWSDRRIAGGAHDSYIRKYAKSVKAFTRDGGHVTLRLAHEMNGNWYPWAVGANGNTPAAYRAMWRHVHRVFSLQHVPNVRWMWSPNITYTGAAPMGPLYPGNKYVDDIGLSGYNWGAGRGFHWESFTSVFQTSLTALRKVAPSKPLYIAETGCAPQGGNKAAWIADMFRQVKKRHYIAGITWFELHTQRNWKIEQNSAYLKAWKTGVALLQRP